MAKILQGPKYESTFEITSLGKFFFDRASIYSNKICQIDVTTNEIETYSSVNDRCVRLAISLQNRGITPNDVVACCSFNTINNMIPIISSFYIGAKIVNFDPTLSTRQTKYLLELVTPKIIFVEESSVKFIEDSLLNTNLNIEIIVIGASDKYEIFTNLVKPQLNEDKFEPTLVDIHENALMFFSSGTTGLPKAICHSHYSFLNMIEIGDKSGLEVESIMHLTSFYWISGIMILTQCFYSGGTRLFCRGEIDGKSILRAIEKYKLTGLFLSPILTYKLTDVENSHEYDTSSLRCLLTGGTAISVEQFKRLEKLFDNASIVFGYGLSEAGMVAAFHCKNQKNLIKTKIGSCGKVAAETFLKVVDPNSEEILGPNEKGEIRIKSQALMIGYYKVNSSDCFDSDGFLKTGDIGYYDEDECIYVVERIKEMFKYLSWHIVPSAIEAVLLEHPAVKETVVFGIPKGDEGEIPAACVVLKDNVNVSEEEILQFVADRVSDKERLRGGVRFFQSIPKTPSGKSMRNKVRDTIIKSL